MGSRIGRRTTMEYTARTGNYFPPRGQVARGTSPLFAINNSGCIGAFDTTTLVFSAPSLAAGFSTLTAKGYLSNVQTLTTGAYDIGQAHFSVHAYTTPAGTICGQIGLELGCGTTTIAAGDALPAATRLGGLYVSGTLVIYAPSPVSNAVSISVPVSVAFLGDVVNS